ncbi:MAG TPA: DUF4421 family protein [Oligoflexus sp.]|uniref:DUF4421 family protein n=1 Tax=Oligoflexus sp. TaxID=1971216 RepID=UPI002D7E17FB|nr:DUF4421 family protein [Oligoflexus sp.]HET9236675.1 DUF4421 family protein [Oligoflexus sp.]
MHPKPILQALVFPGLMISCASPSANAGRDQLLIRPSLTTAKIRFESGLKPDVAARTAAQGLPVPKHTILEPNTDSKPGLSLGYHGFSLAISQSQPLSEEAIATKGNTKAVDYQFHGAVGWLGFDVYYQEYQGMHDTEASAATEPNPPSAYLHAYYPDLQLARKGFNLFYINDAANYKHNAHMHQAEYQAASADSLLFLTSFDYLKIQNIPGFIRELYQDETLSSSMEASAISFMLGYAFILKSDFGPWFAANVFVGRSYQIQGSLDRLPEKNATPLSADKAIVSSSVGIDRKSWFFGLSSWVDSLIIPLDRMESTFNTSSYEIFLGCRL